MDTSYSCLCLAASAGTGQQPVLQLVDASILAAAFILAHFLRFEDGLTPSRLVFLRRSLPLVILLRLPVFAIFGLYRAVWRHAGALDILRIVTAVTLGTAAAYVGLGLLHGFYSFSRGVLFIDWMAVILALIISRFGFRGLRSYLTALSRRGVPVAVYGAGEDGALTLATPPLARSRRPVAIVDDRKEGETRCRTARTLRNRRLLSLKKNYN
jgi:UDP-GlcNAc:undecaprenyl-phosphate GlcNAc-1-phosphate transferase